MVMTICNFILQKCDLKFHLFLVGGASGPWVVRHVVSNWLEMVSSVHHKLISTIIIFSFCGLFSRLLTTISFLFQALLSKLTSLVVGLPMPISSCTFLFQSGHICA